MRSLFCACIATAAALAALTAPSASAMPAVGVTPGGELVRYDTDAPGTILERHAITGLQPGEKVMGMDVRPATGQLYALGIVSATDDTGRIYVLDPGTGVATEVGTTPFKTDLNRSEYGFDFNPVVDRIRVVDRLNDNVRVYPDTGALVQADTESVDERRRRARLRPEQRRHASDDALGLRLRPRPGSPDRRSERRPPEGSPNSGNVVAPFAGPSGISTDGRSEMDFAPGGAGFLTARA